MIRLLIPALLLLAPPALARPAADAPGWFDATEADQDDDAVAEGPDVSADAATLDLEPVASALEDGVRRMLCDRADPMQAFPVEVAPAPDTTAAELRGLLDGSSASDAKLAALRVQWVLWKGETVVGEVGATLLPSNPSALLQLGSLDSTPGSTAPRLVMPGGLGVTWGRAEAHLTRLVKEGQCEALPVVADVLLATLVPPPFVQAASKTRDAATRARGELCAATSELSFDRIEMRPVQLHFNLFDTKGQMRGGLNLSLEEGGQARLAYPLFKRLPR